MENNKNAKDIKIIRYSVFIIIFILSSSIIFNDKTFTSFLQFMQVIFLNYFEWYYIFFGIIFVFLSIVLAISPLGKIKLGKRKRPRYSLTKWSIMVFTATMAADIIFFSLHEWVYYANEIKDTYFCGYDKFSSSIAYSFFHWGITPWSFYLLPAVIYAYIMFNNKRECYKISHACRPLINNRYVLMLFDIICVVSLICVVSTTFSLATPLISSSFLEIVHIGNQVQITISVIIIVGILCLYDNLLGIEIGTVNISKFNYLLFVLLLLSFFILGKPYLILQTGVTSFFQYISNFIGLSLFKSKGDFTVVYTVFYWSYWIAWSIATPFFIALISEGMKIRDVIIYGYIFGVASTFISFTILGTSVMAHTKYLPLLNGFNPEQFIISSILSYPYSKEILLLLIITMIFMYVTTLNSVIIIASQYTSIKINTKDKIIWTIFFIFLPILLVKSQTTTISLKTIAVFSSLPISLLLICVIINFIKILKEDNYFESKK